MEPLDREIAEAFTEQAPKQGPARLLIVGAADDNLKGLVTALKRRHHECTCVPRVADAHAVLAEGSFDLVVVDMTMPDGDGVELARALHETSPSTKIIVLFESRRFSQVVQALRYGVLDLVDRRVDPIVLAERIDSALAVSRAHRQREGRVAQLEVVCRKLMVAREEVSEHLDKLCKDLAAAYQDMSGQMSEVVMASELRTLLKQELDLEDLLRTALEYLLAKTGPTNAAVFLPDQAENFDLGAYVNYDCPRETITVLLNHLCQTVCPQMARETEIVSFNDADAFAEFIGADAGFLAGCEVVALSCVHDGKCLAVLVLFRSREDPFGESVAATLEILRGIFAEQIANVIKVHHRATPQWPKDPLDDEYDCKDYDDFGFGGLVA